MNMLCVVIESTCGAVINVEAANCCGASNRSYYYYYYYYYYYNYY